MKKKVLKNNIKNVRTRDASDSDKEQDKEESRENKLEEKGKEENKDALGPSTKAEQFDRNTINLDSFILVCG